MLQRLQIEGKSRAYLLTQCQDGSCFTKIHPDSYSMSIDVYVIGDGHFIFTMWHVEKGHHICTGRVFLDIDGTIITNPKVREPCKLEVIKVDQTTVNKFLYQLETELYHGTRAWKI
jgi:hypothetical protein